MDAPIAFRHDLDLDLFALDRLDALRRRAPEGRFDAYIADQSRDRPRGTSLPPVELEGTIAEEVARRSLGIAFRTVDGWAPEYAEPARQVIEASNVDRGVSRHGVEVVIRVFSAGSLVAFHADGEQQLNCGVGGRNAWHVYPPNVLTESENEALLRGGHFMAYRDGTPSQTFDLHVGDGFGAPPRWPHWIEHPGTEPAVSFEVGYWTADDVRARKVWDVNYMLRKARLNPTPPGRKAGRDRVKQQAFDAISRLTGKGAEFRGV